MTMQRLKPFAVAVAILLAILGVGAALPFFVSADHYIPRIEREASARLKQPVSIKSLRLVFLPTPHVTLYGITVGTARQSEDIQLGEVVVVPDVFSLPRDTIVIRSVDIHSLAVTQKAVQDLYALAQQPGTRRVRIETIRLSKAMLNFGKTPFGPYEAKIAMDTEGNPDDASIRSEDGKLKVLVKRGPAGYRVDASAKDWTMPVGLPLKFDELRAQGTATAGSANIPTLMARLYGGTATGNATIDWQKGLRLTSHLGVEGIEMKNIASMLSSSTHISGRLSAKPVLTASAPSSDKLLDTLRVESPFSVQNGVLYGFDIEKAAMKLIKGGSSGGETHFQQLSGHVVAHHGNYAFSGLNIVSGALAATGSVNVSPRKALNGQLTARVKVAGIGATVPLQVTGTVSHPSVAPSSSMLAGVLGKAGLAGLGTGKGGEGTAGIGSVLGASNSPIGRLAEEWLGKRK